MAEKKISNIKFDKTAHQEKISQRVFLDIEGYNSSKIETVSAIALSEQLTEAQKKALKKQLKEIYIKYNELDDTSQEYLAFITKLFEWAFSNQYFKVYCLGTTSEFHNTKLKKMMRILKHLLAKQYTKKYLLIAPNKKEGKLFRRRFKTTSGRRHKKHSYRQIIRKYFRNYRFFTPNKDETVYFYWLVKQINIAYSKVLKYALAEPSEMPRSHKVFYAYTALLPFISNSDLNETQVFNVDTYTEDR
jgi:hypothetical protein